MRTLSSSFGGLAAVAILGLVGRPATAQQPEQFVVSGDHVAIYNLAGAATIEAGAGPGVIVEVQRAGPDAAKLRVEQGSIADLQTLRVIFPGDHVVYAASGDRWSGHTDVRVRTDGTFGDDRPGEGRGQEVTIRRSGTGLDAHADLRIQVPRGQRIDLYLAAGPVSVQNVNGELRVDGRSGPVTTSGTSGRLVVDVGSGEVQVAKAQGDVNIDTGSGDVTVTDLDGNSLRVNTGSGSVRMTRVSASTMSFDTGSGEVTGSGVVTDALHVDTGSGPVELSLLSSPRDFMVDTGSGDVTITVPTAYSAIMELEANAGRIRVDFPVQVTQQTSDYVRAVVGGGSGRMSIDTGSGDIWLRAS